MAAHPVRMRYILLAAFVVGCGGSSLPVEGQTNWSVTLGNWETPTCEGAMRLTASPGDQTTKLAGTWSCGTYGKQASGEIRPDGRVFLDLETSPGSLNGVRATLADDDAIAGDILLGDHMAFAAYRQ